MSPQYQEMQKTELEEVKDERKLISLWQGGSKTE
jgi:hypothetical protein